VIYSFGMASLAFLEEPLPDVIPLTSSEKRRKQELEALVQAGLKEFLRVGQALAEIRNRRLYRTEFPTFEQYVRAKFGLARSSADQLIRSASTAQCLLEAGAELPPGTTEAVIRPISTLPDDADLKSAVWEFVEAIAPECGPTSPLVERVCRTIKNALDGVTDDNPDTRAGRHDGPRSARLPGSPQRETPFVRPVQRLAAWSGFSVEIIVSTVSPPSAATVFKACGTLAERCKLVQERLAANYPELTNG
jgi:hypothetical protein